MPEDGEQLTESILLSTFQLDFTVDPLGPGDEGGRRLNVLHGSRRMDGKDKDKGSKGNKGYLIQSSENELLYRF